MDTTAVIILVCFVAFLYGWACYAIGHSSAQRSDTAAQRRIYSEGQRSILQDPTEIKRAYEYHFGTRP